MTVTDTRNLTKQYPNGAGKTTTVRLLNGTLRSTGGSYSVLGLEKEAEEVRMYEHLSVMENLRFFARLYDLDDPAAKARIRELLTGMELWEKRVYLIRTLLHHPELIESVSSGVRLILRTDRGEERLTVGGEEEEVHGIVVRAALLIVFIKLDINLMTGVELIEKIGPKFDRERIISTV